jgi:transcriptional regulator with XRE-family HTH domain
MPLQSIGKLISEVRRSKGITQKEFALRLQTTQPYISHIEKDKTVLSITSLYNIAQALDVPIHSLLKEVKY